MTMDAVIFGAAGQVGRALQASAPKGARVAALTRADVDLSDAAAIQNIFAKRHFDLIINAAAYTAVDKAESEPDLVHRINVSAVAAMAKAAKTHGTRLVHISTDFVFDGAAGRPYLPGDPANPLSVYGVSKRGGEIAAGSDALIVRTSWVYRAGHANFVHTMLRLMSEKPGLSVVADQIGTPTHADGLAQALWQLIAQNRNGIYHYSDSGVASWYDFAVAIQEEALSLDLLQQAVPITPIATSDYPTPAARPPYSVMDKSKTWHALGAPAPHWRAALRAMLQQVKDNG